MRDDVRSLMRWIGAHDLPDRMVVGCAHTAFPRLGARTLGVRLPGCVAETGLDVVIQPLAMGVPRVVVLPCAEHPEAVRHRIAEWTRLLPGGVSSGVEPAHWWSGCGTLLDLGDIPLPRRIVLGLGLRDDSPLSLGQDDEDRTLAALRMLAAQGRCDLAAVAGASASVAVPVLGGPPAQAAPAPGSGAGAGEPAVLALTSAPVGVDLTAGGCVACGVCVNACPTGALALEADGALPDLLRLVQLRDRCRADGQCVQLCPQRALSVSGVPQAPEILAEPVRVLAEVVTASCERCGVRHPAAEGRLCPVCAFRQTSSFGSRMPPGFQRPT